MRRISRSAAALISGFALTCPAIRAQEGASHRADLEFLIRTIEERAAMPKGKAIDWPAAVKALRPRIEACRDEKSCVLLAMELLATLKDSHSGILSSRVNDGLPSKWDGLYGAGLWFGSEGGKWVLRGRMEGHALDAAIVPGSLLLAIEERPAWLALGEERERIARILGISSDHSLYASLGNRLLPFGDKQQLRCTFLLPDGKTRAVELPRWGPGGKAFDLDAARRPAGFARADGAASCWLPELAEKKVGYLGITGSMDEPPQRAFDTAFDALRGMDALLLDGRAMGGGSDASAWAMCGRLFRKAVANGSNGTLAPSGSWQHDGPVVFLMDELMVSSAETFTWALLEHERVLSIGRPTGGWAIIPQVFEAPSGLFRFRVGVTDRGTPVRNIKTEGTGTPPDLIVPFGPLLSARGDLERELATAALACLLHGADLAEVRKAFHALGEGDFKTYRAFCAKQKDLPVKLDLAGYADEFLADLRAELDQELALANGIGDLVPDARGLARRAPRLLARAKSAGESARAKKLEAAVKALAKRSAR
ncbi:MAG: hypothetical protein IPN34_18210 [Planctomycetes bacterium]|nr:hypothetical protein [Planctomycetota bacterium]